MIIAQHPVSEYVRDFSIFPILVGSTPTTGSPYTLGDGVFQDETFTESYKNYEIILPLGSDVALSTGSPGIFTMSGRFATRIANGIGSLVIDGGSYRQSLSLDFRSKINISLKRLNGFSSGTLGDVTLAAITAKIAGGGQLAYFNSTNGDLVTAKNPLCWGKDYDFTGIPTSHLYGFAGGGALITPRHLVCSNHYEPDNKVGRIIKFLSPSQGIISRTVISQTTGSDQPTQGLPNNPVIPIGDLCVLLLSAAVPNDVMVYPIAGNWVFKSVLDNTSGGISNYDNEISCAFITTNQHRHVVFSVASVIYNNWTVDYPNLPVFIGEGISFVRTTSSGGVFKSSSDYSANSNFQSQAIIGDSGSPVFVPIGENGLALYTVMTYPDRGTLITQSLANALVEEVDLRAGISTGLTVTVATDPTL